MREGKGSYRESEKWRLANVQQQQQKRAPVLWVRRRVNNPIHIEVEVVKLESIRVGQGGIDRETLSLLSPASALLHAVGDHLWVLRDQPLVEG